MDFDSLPLQHVDGPCPHVAGQKNSNSLGFQRGCDVGLASAPRLRKHSTRLLHRLLFVYRKEAELQAMTKMVINGLIDSRGDGNDAFIHFTYWY